MLGINLAFVGITLFINGFISLRGSDKSPLAIMNTLTGLLIVFFNLFEATTATQPSDYVRCFGGLLFGFTNLIIAANTIWKTGEKGLGIYSVFAFVCALVLCVYFIFNQQIGFGILWAVWSPIWAFTFVSDCLYDPFKKATQWMAMFQGVFATFLVGLLVIFQVINLGG